MITKQPRTPRTISEFELFTGGPLNKVPHSKTADFVIFYNIALSNIEKMMEHYEKGSNKKIKLDATYRILAEYLWKAHTEARNKNDLGIKPGEKEIIDELIAKLEDIRNYHSHIWHDNDALVFEKKLREFVEYRYERAMIVAFEEKPAETIEFEKKQNDKKGRQFPLFKTNNGKSYITDEGKIFFLSFFLTTGQMSSFLQQRKGSKRTDQPLFKTKHMVYKHYCHRDGASILGFHHEDDLLSGLDQKERKNILMARQAYKLITYLNDYPEYLTDNDTMPLMLPAPEKDEKLKKVNTVSELQEFITAHSLLKSFQFNPIFYKTKDYGTEDYSKDETEKKRSISIAHSEIGDYHFHIGFGNLYKLVMLSLKYRDARIEERLKERMKSLANNRKELYEILIKSKTEWTDDDHNYLINPENQYLRGYRVLTEKGMVFFEKYLKGKEIPNNQIDGLAELIRPGCEPGKYEAEPIIVNAQDFVEKTEQKFRAGNRFVFYAAKYLIDHNIVKDWYWEMEKFIPQKIKTFQKEFNDNADWRLCIENDHVTIGIPKVTLKDDSIISSRDRYLSFYQFSLGPRTLRYLLAYHIMNIKGKEENTNINDFLAIALKQDLDTLNTNPFSNELNLVLLEEPFLPAYLKEKEDEDVKQQINKITRRFDFIKNEWDRALAQKEFLKRAEKNQIVMDCYQLFDWTGGGKEVKFLRKDEFKQMSVCHYSLGHKVKKTGEKKAKFYYLYEDLFGLNHRKPAIPQEVKDLLYGNVLKSQSGANSLDELMVMVIENRKRFIGGEIDFINFLPKSQKKEKAERILKLSRTLGLQVPPVFLNENEQNELQGKRRKTLDVLPFPVSPVLVLKYFEHISYKSDYQNIKGNLGRDSDIFKMLRNKNYSSGLYAEHYDIEFAARLMVETNNDEVRLAYKKQHHKWVGVINTTHTEDVLLWQIATRYLKGNPYTKEMADAINRKGNLPNVANLHDTEIKIELKKGSFEKVTKSIWVNLKMHQLDDVMFATEKERLRRVALHYLHRHEDNDEKTYWEAIPPHKQNDESTKVQKLYQYQKNSGSAQNPIPYQVLREEMKLVAQHGIYLTNCLLEWERNVLYDSTKNLTAAEQQKFLMQRTKIHGPADKFRFANFDEIVEMHELLNMNNKLNINYDDLKKYRNFTFHNRIPVSGSYSWWASPESDMGRLFKITEPFHWPKENSRFKK